MKKKGSQRNFPKAWFKLSQELRQRKRAELKVKRKGGNKFKQLEARLMDSKGDKVEDIVIYAIRTITSKNQARDFYEGYAKDIEENPNKYPKEARAEPKVYAKEDTYLALNMHFYNESTHDLWEEALKF